MPKPSVLPRLVVGQALRRNVERLREREVQSLAEGSGLDEVGDGGDFLVEAAVCVEEPDVLADQLVGRARSAAELRGVPEISGLAQPHQVDGGDVLTSSTIARASRAAMVPMLTLSWLWPPSSGRRTLAGVGELERLGGKGRAVQLHALEAVVQSRPRDRRRRRTGSGWASGRR